MQSGYRTKIIRMGSGERFPLMISCATRQPDAHVSTYSIVHHRMVSINTAKREIDGLCLFHEWLDQHNIELSERLESGRLFSPIEVDSLSESLRASKKQARIVNGEKVRRIVSANTHGDRLAASCRYIKWRMAPLIVRIADPARAIDARQRLKATEEQIEQLCKTNRQTQREGLTEEERAFLLEVCRPDDPRNPFKPATRYRNYAIILFLDELGTREGEPLGLKGVSDVHLSGSHPRIIITPRPNDPDEKRREPPLVKTMGRTLAISPQLASVLNTYANLHRSKLAGAKRQHYFFMGTRNGYAMSLDSIYDIFVVLRNRFPDKLPNDLNPHKMRHTWNARFKRRANELGWGEAITKVVNNYLMGWAKNSKQSAKYSHSEIVREAHRILTIMQSDLETIA